MPKVLPVVLLFLFFSSFCNNALFAQDVEPRRWSSLPLDAKFIGAGYAFTFGDVSFDPQLGVQDATV